MVVQSRLEFPAARTRPRLCCYLRACEDVEVECSRVANCASSLVFVRELFEPFEPVPLLCQAS